MLNHISPRTLTGFLPHMKKRKYLASAFTSQYQHFLPFVISADGLLGNEAMELLKILLLCFTDK
jgi:hypothetical protein